MARKNSGFDRKTHYGVYILLCLGRAGDGDGDGLSGVLVVD